MERLPRAAGGEGARQRSDARRNRAAILAAAAHELSVDAELNMQGVAATAGVSRATLYRHFPTRSSLEEALRAEGLATAERVIADAATGARPPLASLRRVISALAELTATFRLDLIGALPLGGGSERLAPALAPLLDELRGAAELAPALPERWMRRATTHLIDLSLELGSHDVEDRAGEAARFYRSLTEPLDQGLVILDPSGSLLAINPLGARLVAVDETVEPGDRMTEPRVQVLYEDGSPCPDDAYPLNAAVMTGSRHTGVRGHAGADGAVTWVAVDALPLRRDGQGLYGIVGVLSDVTAEKQWEAERLRPPGRLGLARPVPLDIARVLDEIPPHLFPEQFVSEARRITGTPVALYVLDIDGSHLLRLAGAEEFPARLDAPLALGPELAPDGIPALQARVQTDLPGVAMAPMWLRGRAVGVLLAVGGSEEGLLDLARHGAGAMELAGGYTDAFDAARRRKETTAAAELQQSLVPPRIARIGSGELAGSVLPSYEVGGDWFDYVENRDGAWIAVADAAGKGATAGALGGIALAALRAARRSDQTLEQAAHAMHEVIYDVGRPEFFVTAIVARWHAVYSVFSWINCGHPPPLVVRPDNTIEQLMAESNLPLGLLERERRFSRRQRRLGPGELLILHSDGITARRTEDGLFGLDGIEQAVARASSRSATATARAIQEAVISASVDPLQDDAVVVVLAPTTSQGSGG
jgi:AcrR family transcriptional regulator